MRIEIKARRGASIFESLVQSGAGVTNAALPVPLSSDRQAAEIFVDHFWSPISLLNFEPFSATMRPNGLRDENWQKPRGRCETKRRQTALCKRAGDGLLTCLITEGPGRKQRF